MAVVVLPGPQSSNLGLLGGVAAESARDYLQKTRADEFEARRRQERLADIQDARSYARDEDARLYQRGRTDKKADEKDARKHRLEDTIAMNDIQWLERLVAAGYLDRAQMDNPDAVASANEQAMADGMTARRRNESEQVFKERQRENAMGALNRIAKDRSALMKQYEDLNKVLSAPPPVITDKQVIDATVARLSQGGKSPDFQAIQEMAPMVREEMQGALFLQEKAEKERALIQKSMLADNIRSLTTRADNITSKTGAVEDWSGDAEPQAAPPTTTAPTKTGKTFEEMISERMGKTKTRPISPDIQAKHDAYTKSRLDEIGTFGASAPAAASAAPTASGAPAATSSMAPITSLKGIAQRLQGADVASPASRIAGRLTPEQIVALPDVPIRYGMAAAKGLWSGDYSVPQKGLLTMAGEGIGNSIVEAADASDAARLAEEQAILDNSPYSLQAQLIRQRRRLPEPGIPVPETTSPAWPRPRLNDAGASEAAPLMRQY